MEEIRSEETPSILPEGLSAYQSTTSLCKEHLACQEEMIPICRGAKVKNVIPLIKRWLKRRLIMIDPPGDQHETSG